MPNNVDRSDMLLSGLLHASDDREGSLHYKECSNISDALLKQYASLVTEGRSGRIIALAMLAATLNVYDMFGLESELPDLFRNLADKIEGVANPYWH